MGARAEVGARRQRAWLRAIATVSIVAVTASVRTAQEPPPSDTLGTRDREITGLDVTSRGNLLVLATSVGKVEVWNWKKRELVEAVPAVMIFQPDEGKLAVQPALSPKGDWLALRYSVLPGITTYDLDGKDRKAGFALNRETKICAIAWGAKGKYVWTATDGGTVEKILPGEQDESEELVIGSEAFTSLAVHRGNKNVFAGDAAGKVHVVSVRNLKVTSDFVAHEGAVHAIVFHPKGKEFYTCGADGMIKEWSTSKLEELRSWKMEGVTCLAVSTKGEFLASGSASGSIEVRELDEPERPRLIPGTSPVRCLAFLPTGETLASASGKDLVLWDLDS